MKIHRFILENKKCLDLQGELLSDNDLLYISKHIGFTKHGLERAVERDLGSDYKIKIKTAFAYIDGDAIQCCIEEFQCLTIARKTLDIITYKDAMRVGAHKKRDYVIRDAKRGIIREH